MESASFTRIPSSKEIFWEPIFNLMYYGGWTYWDAYYLPVNARRWMLDRIVKEMKGGGGDDPNAPLAQSRAPHHNTEEVRSLQERTRVNPPPRLIRFS